MNEFEFKFEGESVFTGTKVPDVMPLSFTEYPAADMLDLGDIRKILSNPHRKTGRELFSGKDWIKNQGRKSSCNAYACMGALKRARYRKGLDAVELAPEYSYAMINGGKDQGSMLDDGMLTVSKIGMPKFGTVPYEAHTLDGLSMEQKRFAAQEAADFKYREAYKLPTGSIRELWTAACSALARGEMIVVAVHVGNSFMGTKRTSFSVCGFDRGPGNHAVMCDDIIIPNGVSDIMDIKLDMVNSWGLRWGENGRGLLTPKHLEEPARWHAMYAVRSTNVNADEQCLTLAN